MKNEDEDIEAVLEFMQLLSEYNSFEDACHVLKTYILLHKAKIGQHWLWCAIERIVKGEKEMDVLEDFGYVYYDGDGK
jgi:hypothetical protein